MVFASLDSGHLHSVLMCVSKRVPPMLSTTLSSSCAVNVGVLSLSVGLETGVPSSPVPVRLETGVLSFSLPVGLGLVPGSVSFFVPVGLEVGDPSFFMPVGLEVAVLSFFMSVVLILATRLPVYYNITTQHDAYLWFRLLTKHTSTHAPREGIT